MHRVLADLESGAVLEKGCGTFLLFPSSAGRMLLKPLATHELMMPVPPADAGHPDDDAVRAMRAAVEPRVVQCQPGALWLPSRGVLRKASERADDKAAAAPRAKRSKKSAAA